MNIEELTTKTKEMERKREAAIMTTILVVMGFFTMASVYAISLSVKYDFHEELINIIKENTQEEKQQPVINRYKANNCVQNMLQDEIWCMKQ
jgi:flagellar basal body-associated protein FliL